MTTNIDDLAKHVRSLIIEIDDLGYIFNELTEKYLVGHAEDEKPTHPIRKLSNSIDAINKSRDDVIKVLVADNILDANFRRSLKKLATLDALKDGNTAFVSYVTRYVKD